MLIVNLANRHYWFCFRGLQTSAAARVQSWRRCHWEELTVANAGWIDASTSVINVVFVSRNTFTWDNIAYDNMVSTASQTLSNSNAIGRGRRMDSSEGIAKAEEFRPACQTVRAMKSRMVIECATLCCRPVRGTVALTSRLRRTEATKRTATTARCITWLTMIYIRCQTTLVTSTNMLTLAMTWRTMNQTWLQQIWATFLVQM